MNALNYDLGFFGYTEATVNSILSCFSIIRCYWFDSFHPEEKEKKQGFFHLLEMNRFTVEAKPLRRRGTGLIEKGADISLATELLSKGFKGVYDVAIVVTGDDDFAKAIEEVANEGKEIILAGFENNTSGNLKRKADKYICLDDIADKIRRK